MKFTFAKKLKSEFPAIIPIFFQKRKFLKTGQKSIDTIVEKALKTKVFEGRRGEIYTHTQERKNLPGNIVFISLGDPKKLKPAKLLNHLGKSLKEAKKKKGNAISFFAPKELETYGQVIAEALTLTGYDPAQYKTGKEATKRKAYDIQACMLVGPATKSFVQAVERGRLIADAVNMTRDLVNGPPNIVKTSYVEKEALEIAKEFGYKITVLKNKDMEKLGMNGILAVNRGSKEEARLIVMEYWPDGVDKKTQPIVVVGKGVIFDSGGYNLKPSGFIEDMHLDMAGAAAVLGLFKVLKKLKVPVPVIGITPVTENSIDSDSYKPSEIITTYAGKTVEITNTDAEGRMILCDAITYAIKNYKPRYLVDIATLTGACMIALGDRYAGLFTNDKELKKFIRKAGDETDELVWPMPIHPDFVNSMKGEISDLRNGEDAPRYAGASKGAAFLREFVGKTKWAHLDIAGVAYGKNPKPYEAKRATGYGVRLMVKFLEQL